jgi:hypothetical protein
VNQQSYVKIHFMTAPVFDLGFYNLNFQTQASINSEFAIIQNNAARNPLAAYFFLKLLSFVSKQGEGEDDVHVEHALR